MQYAKFRMLELYYNFFDKFCDVKNLKSWSTDSLYLALAEKNYMTVSSQMRERFEKKCRKMTVETLSRRMQNPISSLERVAVPIKSMINGS